MIKNLAHRLIFIKIFFMLGIIFIAAGFVVGKTSFALEFSLGGDKFLDTRLGNVKLRETATGKILGAWERTDHRYWDFAAFVADGESVLLIDNEGNTLRFVISTGAITQDRIEKGNSYTLSADKKLLAVARINELKKTEISIYSIEQQTFRIHKTLKPPMTGISTMYFLQNNQSLLTLYTFPKIIALPSGKVRRDLSSAGAVDVSGLSADAKYLLMFDRYPAVSTAKPTILNLITGRKKTTAIEEKYAQMFFEINIAGYSPVNSTICFIGGASKNTEFGGILLLWNTATGKITAALAAHRPVVAAALTVDGEKIIYQDSAGEITLANARTGEMLYRYNDSLTDKNLSASQKGENF